LAAQKNKTGQKSYLVVGLMSGTSLDGLDVVLSHFELKKGKWSGKLISGETIPYNRKMREWLVGLEGASARELAKADADFGKYMGKEVRKWLLKNNKTVKLIGEKVGQNRPGIDFIASHGHTLFHEPSKGYTYQLGSGATLAAETGLPVVCDFRSGDVALKGQGAPLVPIGDKLLFNDYVACLNLGGFANVSFDKHGKRIAFDICPVNIVLNELAQRLGNPFDKGGKMAQNGEVNKGLLEHLNKLKFYQAPGPKSLGKEWVEQVIWPLLDGRREGGKEERRNRGRVRGMYWPGIGPKVEGREEIGEVGISTEDLLATFVEHIAFQIARALPKARGEVLITGGGAFNTYLMDKIKTFSKRQIALPEPNVIAFKEGYVFGFLAALRWEEQINCLSSVTGALKDNIGGAIYL